MRETEKIMKEMKKDNEDILIGTSKYLTMNATKYLQTMPKILSNTNAENVVDEKENQMHGPLIPNIPRPMTDISQYEKNRQVKNFKYVNAQVRSQLMRAFSKYNPKIHHDNVMKLGAINNEIRM